MIIDSKENRFNVLALFPKIIFHDYGCAFVSGYPRLNKNRTKYGTIVESIEANYLGRMSLSYEYVLYVSQNGGEGRQASKYRVSTIRTGKDMLDYYRTYYMTLSAVY